MGIVGFLWTLPSASTCSRYILPGQRVAVFADNSTTAATIDLKPRTPAIAVAGMEQGRNYQVHLEACWSPRWQRPLGACQLGEPPAFHAELPGVGELHRPSRTNISQDSAKE